MYPLQNGRGRKRPKRGIDVWDETYLTLIHRSRLCKTKRPTKKITFDFHTSQTSFLAPTLAVSSDVRRLGRLPYEKSSIPTGLVWNTNLAAMTSCKNALNPRLSGHFSKFGLVFFGAQVSSGSCETTESCKIANF